MKIKRTVWTPPALLVCSASFAHHESFLPWPTKSASAFFGVCWRAWIVSDRKDFLAAVAASVLYAPRKMSQKKNWKKKFFLTEKNNFENFRNFFRNFFEKFWEILGNIFGIFWDFRGNFFGNFSGNFFGQSQSSQRHKRFIWFLVDSNH